MIPPPSLSLLRFLSLALLTRLLSLVVASGEMDELLLEVV